MKIKRLTVTNVTSYKEETSFQFDDRLNILIGPNGGGKSNILKILAVILSEYFIPHYEFKMSENESSIELIENWSRRKLEKSLDRFTQDKGDQIIEIHLIPEESDITNIKMIGENLEKLNKERLTWENVGDTYPPFECVDSILDSDCFIYRIFNLELQKLEEGTPAWAFKEYLRTFFIYMRLSSRIPEITLTAPVLFFFSERTFSRNAALQVNQTSEQEYFSGLRNVNQAAMGENTDLFQLGMQHFLRIQRKAEYEASLVRGKTSQDIIEKIQDVKSLDEYLSKLGYDWGFEHDVDNIKYYFVLKNGNQIVSSEKFSSGEKEIVHFLLAMFALNVKDGLILIDEPELHLHSRWQRIILGLFRDFAEDRNNQFIVATHSPVFVTPDTVNYISRIYRTENGSHKVALMDIDLPEKRHLIRMINSQNNERIFFADKVVLVEGITDRLVFSSLIDSAAALFSINKSIEVVEVGGKQSFDQYRLLLKALKTPSFVIADLDYFTEVGTEKIKKLFIRDDSKSWKVLTKDKKSTDTTTLIKDLERAIQDGGLKELVKFWDYFKSRHKRLKETLTETEIGLLERERKKLRDENIYVLADGEIEDYLPNGVAQIGAIVDMLENKNWIVDIEMDRRRNELIDITCSILEISGIQREKLLTDVAARKEVFPQSPCKPERAAKNAIS